MHNLLIMLYVKCYYVLYNGEEKLYGKLAKTFFTNIRLPIVKG